MTAIDRRLRPLEPAERFNRFAGALDPGNPRGCRVRHCFRPAVYFAEIERADGVIATRLLCDAHGEAFAARHGVKHGNT
jgi:hypothetical protein